MTAGAYEPPKLNFIARFFYRRATRQQLSELENFVDALKSLSDEEMGELVIFATHTRHGMEKTGTDLLNPFSVLLHNPSFLRTIIRLIENLQRQKNEVATAALMVWAHSVRSILASELRPTGKLMWQEIARGFGHIDKAKINILLRTGIDVDISDATAIPAGFSD